MSNVPDNLRYRDSHEWIDPTQSPSPVGITDHAQAELTDVVFVDPPKVGTQVTAGQQVCVIESVKAASDIYAPVSGEIVAINEERGITVVMVTHEPDMAAHAHRIIHFVDGRIASDQQKAAA